MQMKRFALVALIASSSLAHAAVNCDDYADMGPLALQHKAAGMDKVYAELKTPKDYNKAHESNPQQAGNNTKIIQQIIEDVYTNKTVRDDQSARQSAMKTCTGIMEKPQMWGIR